MGYLSHNNKHMRDAIGFVIALWAVTQLFSSSTRALDRAATESFKAIEAAAVSAQLELIEQRN
jgi:hypothetical protein